MSTPTQTSSNNHKVFPMCCCFAVKGVCGWDSNTLKAFTRPVYLIKVSPKFFMICLGV